MKSGMNVFSIFCCDILQGNIKKQLKSHQAGNILSLHNISQVEK